MKTFVSNSVQETVKFACEFAKLLKGGECVLLFGDLGAGKTHFVKGLALGLGVDDEITSPTFALHNSYKGRKLNLNHFDLYRIDNADEVAVLGLNDYFSLPDAVSAVEWSQNAACLMPKNAIRVTLTVLGDNERKIDYEIPVD